MFCRPVSEAPIDFFAVGCCRRKGWLAWGLTGVASYLGYVPGDKEAPDLLQRPPSEADIQELYLALEFDPRELLEDKETVHSFNILLNLKVGIYMSPKLRVVIWQPIH